MMRNFFEASIRGDMVVIDSIFPQSEPYGFRNTEVNEYFKRIRNIESYAMYPMKPWGDAWFSWSYGSEKDIYDINKAGYLSHYPENSHRIKYIEEGKRYKFKLAYSYFLAETYVLLPFYESNKIPFVFVLYPGGSFGVDNKKSDDMLKRIFKSKYFKGVVVTQDFTYDYLTSKNLCSDDKITNIYGYFTQFKKEDVKPKKYYTKNKKTLDVCFVAAKYTERGVDKGYDLFIKTAKLVCKTTQDVMFHVVGGFDENDIDVKELGSRIKFYGYKKPNFLSKFYTNMDIFLSPNRPYEIYPGNFDGFPLGIDASYCGTALLVSDELNMNKYYEDGKNLVIIKLDAKWIADKILELRKDPTKLYKLSKEGQVNTQKLFDTDHQINERIKLFNKYANLEIVHD